MKKLLSLALLLPLFAVSQIPSTYYNGTSGLSGYALKTKLHDIISQKYINWHYGDLTNFYNQTDLDIYYDHDASNTTILLDIYSEIPSGPDAYEYTSADLIGSASAEGDGWNREHMMPQSTFYSNYPMYSDLFFVVPTDAKINQLRSNYPYGKAGSTNQHTFTNGSKISNNGTANSPYTGKVYEPIDEFKGDVARSLLYYAVRYEGKLGTFKFDTSASPSSDTNPMDGTEERAFENWFIALLLQWHNQDPVSQREIDRNNAVFAIQKNRNPFIDHPEWVNAIWNQTPDTIAPQAPTNLTVEQNSAYFVTLKWDAPSDTDLLGYKVYKNGSLIGTTKNNTLSIDHLVPGTTYNFSVKAYDNGYLESATSNIVGVSTLLNDVYAPDLMITKYLEGSDNNKAIEITNRTGHAIDLTKYRLSIQFSASNYYFPAPYELEGVVQNNENFVVLNPTANFSCISNADARFVTAAPQLTFNGSQYLELRYESTTIDAIGTKSSNNYDTLGNVSLYRLPSVQGPTNTFALSEWQPHPSNYCENIGSLATVDNPVKEAKFVLYPNPVSNDLVYLKGKDVEKIQQLKIYDLSGKIIIEAKDPFKSGNSINVHQLKTGVYMVNVDGEILKLIKR